MKTSCGVRLSKAWFRSPPDWPFSSGRFGSQRWAIHSTNETDQCTLRSMHVETVQHDHPRDVGIAGHGLCDRRYEVGLGACQADRLREHRGLHDIPIADQRGGAVSHRFEFLFGDLSHSRPRRSRLAPKQTAAPSGIDKPLPESPTVALTPPLSLPSLA